MSPCVKRVFAVAAILVSAAVGQAADPSVPEPLPLPRPARPAAPAVKPEWHGAYDYPRRNPYDVWLYYGVDRRGMFAPRVVYSPYGPYYLYNSQPYLYAPTHSRDFMPYIVDAPSR